MPLAEKINEGDLKGFVIKTQFDDMVDIRRKGDGDLVLWISSITVMPRADAVMLRDCLNELLGET